MYHNNRDWDQDPVAVVLVSTPFNSTICIKRTLTRAVDPYGSSEQEFAPSLLVSDMEARRWRRQKEVSSKS